MNKIITKLNKELDKTISKLLKEIRSDKQSDLIAISFEIMTKNQMCSIIETYYDTLSKKEIAILKGLDKPLKSMYKIWLEEEPDMADYHGMDVDYICYVLKRLSKKGK